MSRATARALDVHLRLGAHLRTWLGMWPPRAPLTVCGSPARTRAGWDGQIQPFLGVECPEGAMLSVPPEMVERVRALGRDLTDPGLGRALAETLDLPDGAVRQGVFRWSTSPAALPDAGVWVSRDDVRVPLWLHPFNGAVLVAFDEAGYAAGVGVKRHDEAGHELAVVTEPRARGRGLAARLVAQAARAVLAAGAVPTYVHDPGNIASARTASRAGFPDAGWRLYDLTSRRRDDISR